MEFRRQRRDVPTVALGIDDDEELNEPATKEEIERGDYTRVVTLAWDETEPAESQ
ncbi:hypothetical protein [Geobacillus sp. YF-1]|uniref:hypothetical protein n=1 Tax=Geobacillus sp. YF-1 TaxID=3457480 RepID=UPI004045682E